MLFYKGVTQPAIMISSQVASVSSFFGVLTFVFRHPLMLLLAVGLMASGIYFAWRKHQTVLTGHLADGVVTRLVRHSGGKGGPTYTGLVKFTKPDGTESEFETRTASSPPMHQVGEKLQVVYYADQERPDVLVFADLYLFPWTSFCAGLFLMLMCAGFAFGPLLMQKIYVPRLTADANRSGLQWAEK